MAARGSRVCACSDKGSDQIAFVSVLEEIRRGVSYISDIVNLERTAVYLWDKYKRASLSDEERQTLGALFERYTRALLDAAGAATHAQPSPLFPLLPTHANNAHLQRDVRGHAHTLLAHHALSHGDFIAAEAAVHKVEPGSQWNEAAQQLLKKVGRRTAAAVCSLGVRCNVLASHKCNATHARILHSYNSERDTNSA